MTNIAGSLCDDKIARIGVIGAGMVSQLAHLPAIALVADLRLAVPSAVFCNGQNKLNTLVN